MHIPTLDRYRAVSLHINVMSSPYRFHTGSTVTVLAVHRGRLRVLVQYYHVCWVVVPFYWYANSILLRSQAVTSLPTVAVVFFSCKIFFLGYQGGFRAPNPPGHGPDTHEGLRAVPEIILRGGGVGRIFFRPLHPQDTQGIRASRPPGHVSALINPPHYGSNMPWPPGQVTPPPPPPLGHIVNKTPSPHRTKKCLRPPPEDNFWNSP